MTSRHKPRLALADFRAAKTFASGNPIDAEAIALTFGELAIGDTFQITPEWRKRHRLPLMTYRKLDDFSAASDGHRGLFRPMTHVIRSAC